MALFNQAMSMQNTQAKNFSETYAMSKKYDRLIKEFDRLKTGPPVEENMKV